MSRKEPDPTARLDAILGPAPGARTADVAPTVRRQDAPDPGPAAGEAPAPAADPARPNTLWQWLAGAFLVQAPLAAAALAFLFPDVDAAPAVAGALIGGLGLTAAALAVKARRDAARTGRPMAPAPFAIKAIALGETALLAAIAAYGYLEHAGLLAA